MEVRISEPSGGVAVLTPEGCVTRIQAYHARLTSCADSLAASMLEMGWLLLQIRRHFSQGTWMPWLRSVGLHCKKAQEWMRIAAEFAHEDGSPDLARLKGLGVLGDGGRVIVNATRLRSLYRQTKAERRLESGERMPGKADSIDEVLSAGGERDEDDFDDELFEEPGLEPMTAEERAARLDEMRRASGLTDNETDLLPDPVGVSTQTTHVARVGDVPSAGDSGTHAPVQNPGVASGVGGAAATPGPGEQERTMVHTTPQASPRGTSGTQSLLADYIAEIERERTDTLSEIDGLMRDVQSGEIDPARGRAAMAAIHIAAQRARRGAA